jgi:hypothetical protein
MVRKGKQVFRESYGKDQDLVGRIYYDDGYINCLTRLTRKTGRQRGYYFKVSPVETSGGRDTGRRFPCVTMFLQPAIKFDKEDLCKILPNLHQIEALMSAITAASPPRP